jgi:hypothetical protein
MLTYADVCSLRLLLMLAEADNNAASKQLLRRQYLYFCTGKASTLDTSVPAELALR